MKTGSSSTTARSGLDDAYEALERQAPRFLSGMLRWMRHPGRRKLRLGMGVAFVGLGMAGPLLPVAGLWMIPIGLLLLAEDAPQLQGPVVEMHLWLERKWLGLRSWARRRFQPA